MEKQAGVAVFWPSDGPHQPRQTNRLIAVGAKSWQSRSIGVGAEAALRDRRMVRVVTAARVFKTLANTG
jgi:hypothetical protein